jgi:hypothetical protein
VIVNGVVERLDCCAIFDGVRGLDGVVRAMFDTTIYVLETAPNQHLMFVVVLAACLVLAQLAHHRIHMFVVDWNAPNLN